MKIIVNPNQEASGEFGYAEAGEYQLRVIKIEQCQKSGSPYPYLKAELEFVDSEVKAVEAGKKVGHLFENLTLKPDAQFRLRDFSEALGLSWGDFDTDEVIGLEFSAKVKIRNYQDALSNEIGKYIPASK